MKLKTRVTLAVTAVTASALLASFVTVAFLVRRDEMGDLDRALLLQAHTAAELAMVRSTERPSVMEGQVAVPESLGLTARYMATYEADGSLISATRSFGGQAPSLPTLGVSVPPEEESSVDLAAGGVMLRGVVLPLGERGQSLLYAASRGTVDEDTRFIGRAASVIFVAAVLITAFVARWLSARLASDVQAIAQVARAVAQGDLGARVGVGVRGSAETKRLGEDMDHMIGRLGALVATQQMFISHAAHELRSPLATIQGELQLALRRPREAAEYQEAIQEALTDVVALGALAEDLLVLARVQAGPKDGEGTAATAAAGSAVRPVNAGEPATAAQAGPGGEVVAVGEVLDDALRMARGKADTRGVALKEIEEGGVPLATLVRGSRWKTARALRNLVDNAVAHTPEGGVVEVRVERGERGERGEESVRLVVTDEGTGVAPEDRTHIFEPFYRSAKEQSGEQEGAGLGLTIARDIARASGGDVLLDDAFHGGARFILVLPAAR
ncbi:sensor histidine kinase [Chondromyces apiculatus]|uniref:histidine kinase n=1 Tax=Chondromyces apiculatus DSM 436 TaxID=1192034 RepID=A0A017SUQ1_9BACT|nr:ATP-binding protein [Chondromyces apiculatus]EYF00340.1 Hypothetical protein CAP_0912 [Chondromyces apiculatus DSM 436]